MSHRAPRRVAMGHIAVGFSTGGLWRMEVGDEAGLPLYLTRKTNRSACDESGGADSGETEIS